MGNLKKARRNLLSSTENPSAAPAAAPGRALRDHTLYPGDLGMWSWAANRISGVLTFFFLFTHVLDIALVRVSPNAFDQVISLYKNPLVNLMELVLVGAVLYHALDGLRVTVLDLTRLGARSHRVVLWAIIVIWVALMIPAGYFMLRYNVAALLGSE